MTIWKVFLVVPMALLGSQALAVHRVTVATNAAGQSLSIDMDSFRKGIDGLVYFVDGTEDDDFDNAVDCSRHLFYLPDDGDAAWRDKGSPVGRGSIRELEMKLVCAKAGSGPLPGHWVGIGFGESIDKDSIQRGSDGLVDFTSYGDTFHLTSSDAANCQQRLIYFGYNTQGARDPGNPVGPGSFAEAMLNYVCANVPQPRSGE